MSAAGFRAMARLLVVGLVVVVALAAADVHVPKGQSASKNWRFTLDHPTILLHVIVASIVVVLALWLLVRSLVSRNRVRIGLSALGLAFLVLAWVMGAQYVATLSSGSLNGMSLGWLGATATYAASWRVARRDIRVQQAASDCHDPSLAP
jgi:hypothetical protein